MTAANQTAANRNKPSERLELSFRACRAIVDQSCSSFARSMRILPSDQRRAMEALYAFMRTVDDIADDESVPATVRRERLELWRDWRRQDSPIVPALTETVDRFAIDPACLTETISGMEQDIEFQPIEDWPDLERYCARVAGTVGQACVAIWGTTLPKEQTGALTAWIGQQSYAVQLTNILRDIVEDARNGRCYLPVSLLSQFGLTVPEFIAGTLNLTTEFPQGDLSSPKASCLSIDVFRLIVETVLPLAEQGYEASRPLQSALSGPGRRSNGLIRGVYGKLFHKIRKDPTQILYRRVRLNWFEKLLVLFGS